MILEAPPQVHIGGATRARKAALGEGHAGRRHGPCSTGDQPVKHSDSSSVRRGAGQVLRRVAGSIAGVVHRDGRDERGAAVVAVADEDGQPADDLPRGGQGSRIDVAFDGRDLNDQPAAAVGVRLAAAGEAGDEGV